MGKGLIGCGAVVVILAGLVMWGVGVHNELVSLDENVNTGWAQVDNAYQRRADLIPNLVKTVEGAADFERETLTEVVEARSRATEVQITPDDLNDPAALARFQQAQDGLSSALSRLLVVIERYPDIKANQNFLQLQDELAGTENRIAVERRRFNEAARSYNTTRRKIPNVYIARLADFGEKAYFEAAEGTEEAPQVDFNFRREQQ